MMVATDGLYAERSMVFTAFGHGLVLTIGSVVMVVWLHLHWEASLVCCFISIYTIFKMKSIYYRIVKKFDFDQRLTVDLNDIFSTPIQAVGNGVQTLMNGQVRSKTSFDYENDNNRRKKGYKYYPRPDFSDEDDDDVDSSFVRRQNQKRSSGQLEMV